MRFSRSRATRPSAPYSAARATSRTGTSCGSCSRWAASPSTAARPRSSATRQISTWMNPGGSSSGRTICSTRCPKATRSPSSSTPSATLPRKRTPCTVISSRSPLRLNLTALRCARAAAWRSRAAMMSARPLRSTPANTGRRISAVRSRRMPRPRRWKRRWNWTTSPLARWAARWRPGCPTGRSTTVWWRRPRLSPRICFISPTTPAKNCTPPARQATAKTSAATSPRPMRLRLPSSSPRSCRTARVRPLQAMSPSRWRR